MTEEEVVFVRKATGLIREAGPWSVMAASGTFLIADGIHYFTAQVPFLYPGANIPLSYFVAAVLLTFPAIAGFFLSVAMPRSSGDYVAVSRTVHPLLGYFEAWLSWFAMICSTGYVMFLTPILFGATFYSYGAMMHSPWWMDVGTYLSTSKEAAVILGSLLVIGSGIVGILGVRAWKLIMNLIWWLPLAGSALTVVAFLYGGTLGPAGVKASWDSVWGAGSWDEIKRVALANGWSEWVAENAGVSGAWGWPGPWTAGATLACIIPGVYTSYGYTQAQYVAGEVSRPKRSFTIGIFGLIIICLVIYMAYIVGTGMLYGEFWQQYDYVMMGGYSDQLKITAPMTPVFTIFSMSLVGAYPWWAFIIAVTGAFWLLNDGPILILLLSRITFGFSFDRFFPEVFAEVNERFRSPHWSIILAMVFGVIACFLFAYSPWFGMLNFMSAFMWRELLCSWACMAYAHNKPEIWERGVATKVAGIPLSTIFGLISTIICTFLLIFMITQLKGDNTSLIAQTIAWSVGPVLFTLYWQYNKSRGIDPSKIYTELPPA